LLTKGRGSADKQWDLMPFAYLLEYCGFSVSRFSDCRAKKWISIPELEEKTGAKRSILLIKSICGET